MVINETKKEFGLKLLNHYTKLMTEYNDSKDEKLNTMLLAYYLNKAKIYLMIYATLLSNPRFIY